MTPNGRRRWRAYTKKCRYRSRREGKRLELSAAQMMARHPGRKLYPLPARPFTARSLVGMTMGARKRQAWLRLQSARFLCDDANSEWSAWRAKYRIGERLRPCPGCCACWGHRISTAYGEIAECCGPQTSGKRKSQIKAMRKWQETLADDCDGSGVLSARKQK